MNTFRLVEIAIAMGLDRLTFSERCALGLAGAAIFASWVLPTLAIGTRYALRELASRRIPLPLPLPTPPPNLTSLEHLMGSLAALVAAVAALRTVSVGFTAAVAEIKSFEPQISTVVKDVEGIVSELAAALESLTPPAAPAPSDPPAS